MMCMPERVKLLGFRVFRLLIGTLKVQSRINMFLRIKVLHFISGSVDGIWPALQTLELSIHIPEGQFGRQVELKRT